MLLSPFSVRYLHLEVGLMYSLRMCRHYCHVRNTALDKLQVRLNVILLSAIILR